MMSDPDSGHESHSSRSQCDSMSDHSNGDSHKTDSGSESMFPSSQNVLRQENDDIRSQLQQLTAEIQRMKCLVIKDGLRHEDNHSVESPQPEKSPPQ